LPWPRPAWPAEDVAAPYPTLIPATETVQDAVTEVLQWYRHETDPNVLFIIDYACAAQYPGQENCNTLGCPIATYCTFRMTQQ
jgi:hypothetical protein